MRPGRCETCADGTALDRFLEGAADRVRFGSLAKPSDKPAVQRRLCRAAIEVGFAEDLLRRIAREVMASEGSRPVDRARWMAEAAHAVHLSRWVVERLAEVSGRSAHFLDHPLQRAVRDLRTLSSHGVFTSTAATRTTAAPNPVGNWRGCADIQETRTRAPAGAIDWPSLLPEVQGTMPTRSRILLPGAHGAPGTPCRWRSSWLAALCLAALAIAGTSAAETGLPRSESPAGAAVYFITPTDGQTLHSPVTVRFGLRGMGVAPAGVAKAKTGHHHLIVDADLPPLDLPIPSSEHYRHFGGGQTQVELDLAPGTHTLQLLLGDEHHVPHDPPVVSDRITITVE